MTQFLGHLMSAALEPCGLILGSRMGKRREREEDIEVEVNDMTVHFKGDARRDDEGGVRWKGGWQRMGWQGEVGRQGKLIFF